MQVHLIGSASLLSPHDVAYVAAMLAAHVLCCVADITCESVTGTSKLHLMIGSKLVFCLLLTLLCLCCRHHV
jgi:hypothetical protein